MVKVNKELIRGSTAIIVLSLLSQDDMYGYHIIKEIDRQSKGVFILKEGTLYPILHGLEAEGSVESYWIESNQGRRRKYYRITTKGTDILKEKSAEWNLFKEAVDQVIGGIKLEPVPEP